MAAGGKGWCLGAADLARRSRYEQIVSKATGSTTRVDTASWSEHESAKTNRHPAVESMVLPVLSM